jgi:hypothetical protein
MSKDVKLIAEAYKKIQEGIIDPHELMNNLVGAITAGSTMLGGISTSETDRANERTITKIVHNVENGNLTTDMLSKTLIRARRENSSAFNSLIKFGENGNYDKSIKQKFIKSVLPIIKKITNVTPEDLADKEADNYLLKKVDNS